MTKRTRKYTHRIPPEVRSEICRKNVLAGWKKRTTVKHKWRTIRVHEDAYFEIREEFAKRNGGTTRHGSPIVLKFDWTTFLLELLHESQARKTAAEAVCKKAKK